MSNTKSKLKLMMGYGCKSARRSTTCVVIWCCINLTPRCGGLFRCTCGRMCLRREGAVCGSGMGAPIIALLLRRFCGEVGAPTAHVGARRGAVRGDNEAFSTSFRKPWENSPASLRSVFIYGYMCAFVIFSVVGVIRLDATLYTDD